MERCTANNVFVEERQNNIFKVKKKRLFLVEIENEVYKLIKYRACSNDHCKKYINSQSTNIYLVKQFRNSSGPLL